MPPSHDGRRGIRDALGLVAVDRRLMRGLGSRYDAEAFKRQIVQLYESGKPSREIRAECDIARSTLQRWVQGIRSSGSTRAADNRTPGQNELIEPRKRNRQLEMEVDVFKQAALIFARRWT